MPTASETPNQAARPIGTHDHAFMPRLLPSGRPMKYRTFTVRLWFIYPTPRRPATAAGPRPGAHFPRSCRDLHHTGRHGTVHRQAPCRAVSCRWAAAHPGAAFGAWRISPGAARASSQASARPLPQGRARRPSRSAPTTTGSSRPQAAHPGHWPCPLSITRSAVPIRYGRTPLPGPVTFTRSHRAGTTTGRQPGAAT